MFPKHEKRRMLNELAEHLCHGPEDQAAQQVLDDILELAVQRTISEFSQDAPGLGLRHITLGPALEHKISSDDALRLVRAVNSVIAQGIKFRMAPRHGEPHSGSRKIRSR